MPDLKKKKKLLGLFSKSVFGFRGKGKAVNKARTQENWTKERILGEACLYDTIYHFHIIIP